MSRLTSFSPSNPTGDAPGMEPVRIDVLKAAVNNAPAQPAAPANGVPLVSKNVRLPADLVDYIDFVFTKNNRMRKQDAYTQALEAYFRPKMKAEMAE
jgi:hypothetical protein